MKNIKQEITEEGFLIRQHFYTDQFIDEIIRELDASTTLQYNKQEVAGSNLVRSIPFIKDLAHSQPLISLIKQVLGNHAYPLNAFVLDKTQENNWGLDWHQDLKIAVKQKIETPGYDNWTSECGIPHAIPPQEILEKRLSARIHLDDCFMENGAMLITPQSHKSGILSDHSAVEKMAGNRSAYCEMKKGGLMLFTPLLLHKSPYSTSTKSRRILQIDYVGTSLTNGLEWYS
ncbi:MAG TPA: phytanoyl-CoA dioxygenase family protein [Flavipsychrobacter sp.]|nr:phytanoyl-CoA dioxygenase family protein [Flavipsychrobacter sp.]